MIIRYSFIVPTFNSDKYLDDCLKSLLYLKSKSNYEVIVVDNQSTDDTIKIVKKYQKMFDNIFLYKSKSSKVGGVRNLGIKKANGEYIITVDSDDYVSSDMLATLDKVLDKNYNVDVVKYNAKIVCDNIISLDDTFVSNTNGKYTSDEVIIKLCDEFIDSGKIFGPSWLYCFNKRFWDNNLFKFKNKFQEDFGLIPLVIAKSKTIVCLNKVLYYYRNVETSVTNDLNNRYLKALDVLYFYDFHTKWITYDANMPNEVKYKINEYLKKTLLNKLFKLKKSNDHYFEYKEMVNQRGVYEN